MGNVRYWLACVNKLPFELRHAKDNSPGSSDIKPQKALTFVIIEAENHPTFCSFGLHVSLLDLAKSKSRPYPPWPWPSAFPIEKHREDTRTRVIADTAVLEWCIVQKAFSRCERCRVLYV